MHSKRLKFLVYLALFPLCAFAALAQTNLPGNALLLSGTNQFAYVNSPLLATNGSFTLEIWARRNRTNVQEYLFSLGQSSQTNRYLRMGFRSNDTFVVNGNGSGGSPQSQVSSGDSVQLVSAYAQGAIYATNAIDLGTTSQFDGPLDGQTVMLGQSTSSYFPGFSFVPAGMPGNPEVYAQPQPPQLYAG